MSAPKRKNKEHLFVPAGGYPICATCGCDEDDANVGGQECTYQSEETIKALHRKTMFVVCRFWLKAPNHPVHEFCRVCSTMDKAQATVDELTQEYGPTFIIVPAPLDPPSPSG